jgi:energy-coupling factor transport system ATP-binding protein
MRLQLDHVSVSYVVDDGPPIAALRNVCLSIDAGEHLAIVGPNGSGKSTLALCLAGLIRPSGGRLSVASAGVEQAESSASCGQPHGAIVFQAPDDNLITATVREELALTLEHRNGQAIGQRELNANLTRYQIDDLAGRQIEQLSGGEKQRVAVACALAAGRDLLVLDEPTSHLDIPGRHALFRFLDSLGVEAADADVARITLVLVTQYEDEARRFDRVVHLEQGRMVFDGPGTEWSGFSRRDIPSIGPMLTAGSPSLILSTSNLTQVDNTGWPCPEHGLSGVTVNVQSGDTIGLCGPIGSGKTTLAWHLAGLIDRWSGSVEWQDQSAGRRPVMLIQFPERQLFARTVIEDVAAGPKARGGDESSARQAARAALERVGLQADVFGHRSPFAISGGEKRRAALAGIVSLDAMLYILDEPTAALDHSGLGDLSSLCKSWREAGKACILISHDLEVLRVLTSRVWAMDRGKIRFDGTWPEFDGRPEIRAGIGF